MTSESKAKSSSESQQLLKGSKTIGKDCSCWKIGMAVTATILAFITLAAVTTSQLLPYPTHASCKINWTFGRSCDNVRSALIGQMRVWEPRTNCDNGGERCLYKFLSSEGDTVKGTHTTPVKAYVDDLSFKFAPTPQGKCNVEGFSTSQTWYAVLDYGTNYCNLHNLVEGANLHSGDPAYEEVTMNSICTQYESADCEKY